MSGLPQPRIESERLRTADGEPPEIGVRGVQDGIALVGDDDRGDRKEGRARGLQPAPADERERFWRRVRTPIIGKILDPHGLPGYVIADVNRRRDEAGRFEIRVRVDEALD